MLLRLLFFQGYEGQLDPRLLQPTCRNAREQDNEPQKGPEAVSSVLQLQTGEYAQAFG